MPLFLLAALLAARLVFPVATSWAADPASPVPVVEMGRCVGQGAPENPPSSGKPFDYRQDPHGPESLPAWRVIGYKAEERSGRLIGPNGAPMTDELAAWMSKPEDFSHERVAAFLWVQLALRYRLDETTCVMHDSSGKFLSRLEYQVTREGLRLQLEHGALEKLKVRLAGLDASAPMPADIAKEMSDLAESGTKLPPDVQRVLSRNGAHVGELTASVDAAYESSTRYFDGERSLTELMGAALPTALDATVRRKPAYFEEEEKRIGRLFSADLESRFAGTDAGRDLLDHLRDKKGRINLPAILLLKVTQRPEDVFALAFFSDATGSVTMNHWTAASALLARMSPEERARHAKEFSDPRALRVYLETHPKEREELLDGIDDVFYHEFIHAWQARRDGIGVESLRGNTGSAYPIEWEFEAFREQCRYILTKALKNPPSLERAYGGPDFCLGMLKNYDSFEDGLRRIFMQKSVRGKGAESLPDVLSRQHARESMARRLMNDGLFQKAVQALKLEGLFHGDEAIKDLQLDYAQRKQKFIHERLPELRRRVAEVLPHQFLEMKRPDLALRVMKHLPPDTVGMAALQDEAFSKTVPLLIRPPRELALQDRLAAYAVLNDFHKPWPAELCGAYWRDAAAQADSFKQQAAAATDPAIRSQLLDSLKQWSQVRAEAEASVADTKKRADAMTDPVARAANLKYAEQLSALLHQDSRAKTEGGNK